jgi:hypothetical protein
VSCKGVRVYVRQTSYGGAPDAAGWALNSTTHGDSFQPYLSIQEIAVLSDTTFTGADYATTILADTPIGYWRLGESAGTTAVSQVNSPTVDGLYEGTYQLSQPGISTDGDTAVYFDGTNNATDVKVADSATIQVADVFSVEAWVYLSNSAISVRTVAQKVGGDFVFQTVNTGGSHFLRLGDGVNTIVNGTTAIPMNTWSHVVATKNGSSVHLYLNGVDVTGTVTNHTLIAGVGVPLRWFSLFSGVGAREYGDEAALYNYQLTAAQVLAHYKAGRMPGAPINQRPPVTEGSPKVGDQISCVSGRWSPAPNAYSYQWKIATTSGGSYSNISSATNPVYVPVSGDSGKYLKCYVSASSVGGNSSAVATSFAGPVAA